MHNCLESGGRDLTQAFGRVRMRVNRGGATRPALRTPAPVLALALGGYIASLYGSRLSGRYRINPFFDTATGTPRVRPRVLTEAERAELTRGL